jgi:hypothetical protein
LERFGKDGAAQGLAAVSADGSNKITHKLRISGNSVKRKLFEGLAELYDLHRTMGGM